MRLARADDAHLERLRGWFRDARATKQWGGPQFRYPFDEASFRQDTRIDELDSFVLLDAPAGPGGPPRAARQASDAMIGFGQVYLRLGRIHLGRLAIAPDARGGGLGRQLVGLLIAEGEALFGRRECSLFVLEDNLAALRCYRGCGFEIDAYPEALDFPEPVLYMVRRAQAAG